MTRVRLREAEPLRPLSGPDRRIVAALQVNGRATWAEVARATGASETTVARRAQALLDAKRVVVTAVRDPACAGLTFTIVSRIRCAPRTHLQVAKALARRPDVRMVTLVTGDCDVVCEILLPGERHAARVLLGELQEIGGITSSETETVLRTFKMSHDWSRQELDGSSAAGPVTLGKEPPREHAGGRHELDETDERIMEQLVPDGRRTFSAIADAVGVNETTVRRRLEALRLRGCFRIATMVPAALLGYQAELLVSLEFEPSQLDTAARILAEHPGVRFIALTMGRLGLLCEVVLPSQEAIYEFTNRTLRELPGLRHARVNVELLTLKRAYVLLPAHDLLEDVGHVVG